MRSQAKRLTGIAFLLWVLGFQIAQAGDCVFEPTVTLSSINNQPSIVLSLPEGLTLKGLQAVTISWTSADVDNYYILRAFPDSSNGFVLDATPVHPHLTAHANVAMHGGTTGLGPYSKTFTYTFDSTQGFSLWGGDGLPATLTDLTISSSGCGGAGELIAETAAVSQMLLDDATRSLRTSIQAGQLMVRNARARFIERQTQSSTGGAPLAINGTLNADVKVISSMGTFSGQANFGQGKQRLFFGDFFLQRDEETGSSTASLSGKMSWENVASDNTLFGYFIGAELGRSNIAGAYDGDQTGQGLNGGAYMVREIGPKTYFDGFITLGLGRNDLQMSNLVLDLNGDYIASSAIIGGTISGVIPQKGYEIWPQLSLSYGQAWIGNTDFTATAFGQTDSGLSIADATVSLASIMLRPEIRVPLDGLSVSASQQLLIFAPTATCEQRKSLVKHEACGGGAEVAFSGTSSNGQSSVSAKVMAQRIEDQTSSSFQINLQHRF